MWFEIVPPAAIIVGALFLPVITMRISHSFFIDSPYRRHIHDNWDRFSYVRDERVGDGDPYNIKSLKSIPDE